MSSWLLWRLVKFLGLVAFAGGVMGLRRVPERGSRLVLAYGAVFPGFVGTWLGGWMLMKATDQAPHEPWILLSMALSAMALHLAFLVSHKAAVRDLTHGLALGGLLGAVAVMVLRTLPLGMLAATSALCLVAGLAFVGVKGRRQLVTAEVDARLALRGFAVVAWAEGLSFVVLMLVALPLRLAAGIDLDGDTGGLGWLHGVLFIAYLQALSSAGSLLGWSRRDLALGFVAGLLPFGSFAFERWVARRPPRSPA